ATLTRFRHAAAPGAQPYPREWGLLVEAGTEACLAMATEDSERATALRQASPFAGSLAPREREARWREWAVHGAP
ncbi:MAG: hypothetical protein KGI51_15100, partial [Rhodospirillales bacterium]|nr:hypothetical protein [Rhodospirillales bacterium]